MASSNKKGVPKNTSPKIKLSAHEEKIAAIFKEETMSPEQIQKAFNEGKYTKLAPAKQAEVIRELRFAIKEAENAQKLCGAQRETRLSQKQDYQTRIKIYSHLVKSWHGK